MKIAINALPYTSWQGLETFLAGLISVWPSSPIDEVVVFANQASAAFLSPLPGHIKLRTKRFKRLSRCRLFLYQQLSFPLILQREKFDLLFCPSLSAPWFYRQKIVTIHDAAPFLLKRETSRLGRAFWKTNLYFARSFSWKIATVSLFSRNELATKLKIPAEKIVILGEGTPTLAPVAADEEKKIIDRFKLAGKNYFIYIGNIRPRKNLPAILQAFKAFGKNHPDYLLLIAGKRDMNFNALEKSAAAMGLTEKVVFLGFVSPAEKTVLLKEARALIFVSLYEGFGLPLLEAQISGTPVLASDTSSLPEIAGDSALLVNPYDIMAISKGMDSLATNEGLRMELTRRGTENAKRYSWKQPMEILRSLCKKYEDSRNK